MTETNEPRTGPVTRWWQQPTLLVPGVVGVGFFLIGLAQLLTTWHPNGDWAVAELVIRHTRRVVPLSGPYSAARGYNHPLPLVYAIQWLPYHLFGQRSSAGLATAIWWNGAWLTFLSWMLTRLRAPWLAVAVLAGVVVMSARTPSASLVLPWNPSLGLLPGVVLVFVAWRVALGSSRLLPLATGLSIWCVGAHLGFAPMVVPMVGLSLIGLVWTVGRRHGRTGLTGLGRPVVASVAVAAVLVSPMVWDLMHNGADSNPVHIVQNGRPDPTVATVPRSELIKIVRAELAIPPAWARTEPPYDFMLLVRPPWVPWLAAVGLVVGAAAWRRRAHDELVGMGLSLAGMAGGVAGLASIEVGAIQPWYLLPAHAAALAWTATTVWSAGRSIREFVPSRGSTRATGEPTVASPTRPNVALLPATTAAVLMVLLVPTLRTDLLTPPTWQPVETLVEAARDELDPGSTVLLRGPVNFDGFYTAAIALELDRSGFDVRVPDEHLYIFTEAMRLPPDADATDLMVQLSSGPAQAPAPGAQMLAEAPIERLLYAEADRVSLWLVPD